MKLSVQQRDLAGTGRAASDWIAVPLLKADPATRRLDGAVAALDKRLGGALRSAIGSGDFRGRSGEVMPLYPSAGGKLQRVLLLGLGQLIDRLRVFRADVSINRDHGHADHHDEHNCDEPFFTRCKIQF